MGRIIISVFACLFTLLGYSYGKIPVSIEAENIKKTPTGEIIAEGDVVVNYKNSILKADKIVYNQNEKKIYLYGNVYLKTDKMEIKGKEGWITEKGDRGEFYQVEGVIEGRYYIRARKVRLEGNKYYFYDGNFSTCPFDQYDWFVKTKKGVLIKDDKVVFYNVSLKFCGLPVFYSPYFSYPATDRKTGFLFPEIGNDSYNDFKYRQPFYLVLTRHSDMTFTFDYRNQQGKGLDVEYRNRLSADSYFTGNFVVFNEDRAGKWWEGRDVSPLKNRWRIYGKGDFHYEDFDISLVYDIPSDPYFFEDIYNASRLMRYKSYTKTQLIALTDQKYFSLEINFDFLYDLTKPTNEETLQRLPEIRYYIKKIKPIKKLPFYVDFLSVNTNFYREKGTTGIRSDNTLNLEYYANFRSLSNLFRVSPRATFYVLTKESSADKTPSRNLLSVEDRIRYTFLKGYGSFTHSVIPQLKFSYVSKVNQENLPFFDREDRINATKDIDLSLFNILNFKDSNFLSWEMSIGYTFNDYYYLGTNEIKGNYKPFKNRFYFSLGEFSGENTLYYDFHFNRIVRSITTFSFPITDWLKYSVSHSYDKGLFEGTTTLNQIYHSVNLKYRWFIISASMLNNIKYGYVQRKSVNFILDRKCWQFKVMYKEDYNKITGRTFQSIYFYINILTADIRLPFVSKGSL
ncbi:MAG: LPS-assembly protein LptD [Aquificae bacterium]|nr:LPS-assembly protein LptD [Aquificota bacterium]